VTSSDSGALAPGTIIDGRYEIQSFIARGGMSEVYRARHLQLDKDVAIKILPPVLVSETNAAARFQRESKSLAALKHPNIIAAYGYGVFNQRPYLAIELLNGESLAQRLEAHGRLDKQSFIKIATQICDALSFAHSHGVIHRDIKPSNVMIVGDNEVRLVDFGIAKSMQANNADVQKLTQTGHMLGTVLYMSPEQCVGQPADSRSDIYSLGCMLYQLLVGKPPLDGDTPFAVIFKHTNDLPEQSPFLDEWTGIVLACLAKNPAQRPQSVDLVKDALLHPVSGKTYLPPAPVRPKLRVQKLVAYVVGCAVVCAGVMFAINNERAKETTEEQASRPIAVHDIDQTLGNVRSLLRTQHPSFAEAEKELLRVLPAARGTRAFCHRKVLAALAALYARQDRAQDCWKFAEELKNVPDSEDDKYNEAYKDNLHAISQYLGRPSGSAVDVYWFDRTIKYINTARQSHPKDAKWTYISLGNSYASQNHFSDAIKQYENALRLCGPIDFSDGTDPGLQSIVGLGENYYRLSEQRGIGLVKSKEYLTKAISNWKKIPRDTLFYAQSCRSLLVARMNSRCAKAALLYDEAAPSLYAVKSTPEAAAKLEAAFTAQQEATGRGSLQLIPICIGLTKTYALLGDRQKTRLYFDSAQQIARKHFHEDPIPFIEILTDVSDFFRRNVDFEASEAAISESCREAQRAEAAVYAEQLLNWARIRTINRDPRTPASEKYAESATAYNAMGDLYHESVFSLQAAVEANKENNATGGELYADRAGSALARFTPRTPVEVAMFSEIANGLIKFYEQRGNTEKANSISKLRDRFSAAG
jgi:tRNA A-37 threonylcarbamoyl transferase component Bud32/tetratricopeptide (TPR) repeat protein